VEFSVVIPTHNRASILERTLQALGGQVFPGSDKPLEFEVVVVDDGSIDETPRLLAQGVKRFPFPLIALRQDNRKQGAARNLGARQAAGDCLLFLGDDTTPAPDFLAQHFLARSRRGEGWPADLLGVIGYTAWSESLRVTRFMQFIGEQGWQFGFSLIKDPADVPFNFFYTSNVSLSRRLFLDAGGFDEDFREYGWEDIELSIRLRRRGMRLAYEPRAVAFHHHPTSLRSFAVRQRRVGSSAWVFYRKHPDLAPFLGVFRAPRYSVASRLQMILLTWLCRLTESWRRPDLSRYYPDLLTYHYNVGILQARHAQFR
jgi:glycosyltransferase involved in cell wall biosynthesis